MISFEQIKFVSILLSSIPLSICLRNIQNIQYRHILSISAGIAHLLIIQGFLNLWFILAFCYINYFLVFYKFHPYYNTIFSLSFLSFFHIERMYSDYLGWSLDITLVLMMFTAKTISYAYDAHDYRLQNNKYIYVKNDEKVSPTYMNKYLTNLSILNYTSYMLTFLGASAGPSFNYGDYIAFMEKDEEIFDFKNKEKTIVLKESIFMTMVSLSLFIIYSIISDNFIQINNLQSSYFRNLLSAIFIVFLYRSKYYFGWYLAEVSCHVSEFSLKRKYIDGNKSQTIDFRHLRQAHFSLVEGATAFPAAINAWNTSIAFWLKNYIYERVIDSPKGNKQIALIITRLVSAFWHGFYPGYYLFFLSTVLASNAYFSCRRNRLYEWLIRVHPFGYYIGNFGAMAFTFGAVNYFGIGIVQLTASSTIETWRRCGFIGHILCLCLWLVPPMLVPSRKEKTK